LNEAAISENEFSVILLKADTALNRKILSESAIDCGDFCISIRKKESTVHSVVQMESTVQERCH
jgi:ribosomal protein L20